MRFAVLSHDWPSPHFDLLIEHRNACRTWRLPLWPLPETPIAVERIADHRSIYLTYEGPVSGNRGTVMRVDAGEIHGLTVDDLSVTATLVGRHWRGTIELCDQSGRSIVER
jgi:hypothetical protein